MCSTIDALALAAVHRPPYIAYPAIAMHRLSCIDFRALGGMQHASLLTFMYCYVAFPPTPVLPTTRSCAAHDFNGAAVSSVTFDISHS